MNNIETQAVNTAGLWYAYVSIDGKNVYQGKFGFYKREDAIEEGRHYVETNRDTLTEDAGE